MGLKSRLKSLFGRNSSSQNSVVNKDFAFSEGDAEGYVVNGNTALAMAKSRSGAAVAYTDGITPRIQKEGDGTAGVTGGTAWAKAGRGNMSIAHSTAAQRRADRLIISAPMPTSSRTPLPSPEPPTSPTPRNRKRTPAKKRKRQSYQGRNPNYQRSFTNDEIRRRYRAERDSSDWALYGQESEHAVTDGVGFAFVHSGQYMLTNGEEAAFLDHTEAGYMDSTEIGYIESTECGYYSD